MCVDLHACRNNHYVDSKTHVDVSTMKLARMNVIVIQEKDSRYYVLKIIFLVVNFNCF